MLSAKLSRYDILSQQEKLMRYTIRKGAQTSPWIQTQLKRAGLTPDDIRGKEDLAKIPFTTKQDLRDNYPFGMLACPLEDVVRFHASSGTTGKSTVVYYTQQDIDTWAGSWRACCRPPASPTGTSCRSYTITAFLPADSGSTTAPSASASRSYPSGSGNTKRQIEIMRDFKTTSFTSTPSYALHLAEVAREMDGEPSSGSRRQGGCGGQPWSEAIRRQIETAFGIDAYDNYGLSELCGPGVACECEEKDGLHVWEDYFILEVIDPETGEVLADGEKGELVFTPLWKQAMPLLRYRTGDISRIMDDECGCSLPFKKMSASPGAATTCSSSAASTSSPARWRRSSPSTPPSGGTIR
jgi:phenylacetate-CoA ligase